MAKPTSSEAPPLMLSVSSQVAYGTVGNSAAVPALQWLGIEVCAVPTVILSNHPRLGTPAGLRLPARDLAAILDTLLSSGALDNASAVLTGYFAANDQVFGVARTIARLKQRNPRLLYLCDPVIGDEVAGLYVPLPVAEAIKSSLLPLADIITPNMFELAWLSGGAPIARADLPAARARLGVGTLLATSCETAANRLATVLTGAAGEAEAESVRRPGVPHGTGDLLAGLFLGYLVRGNDGPDALAASIAALDTVIDASVGAPVLKLSALGRGP